jgi:hypothetical protein
MGKLFTSVTFTALLLFGFALDSCNGKHDKPEEKKTEEKSANFGWMVDGGGDYLMGSDTSEKHSGKASAFIRCINPSPERFSTYMQMVKPGEFVGKKVKMTGWIKTDTVKSWAGMWCRIDGPNGTIYDFDNMETTKRPIRGTTDWTKYEITANVHPKSVAIAFGVLLDGVGTVRFDDISFEIIGEADTTKVLNPGRPEYDSKMSNLNFED